MNDAQDWAFTDKGTLYSGVYDDIYFRDGEGLAETNYVFLKGNHLLERLSGTGDFAIGELGFGTGLNFLCTWKLWSSLEEKKNLTFISCEKHPLGQEVLADAHSCFPELKEYADKLRASMPLNENGFHLLNFEGGRIRLILLYGDATTSLKDFNGKVDAWYLDGFSPAKNPEMWSPEIFQQVGRHSRKGATLATFTAAGFVRRGLVDVGFEVERIKGYGHKRHMVTGTFTGYDGHEPQTPPWFRIPAKKRSKDLSIAIVGAGFAGASLARALSRFDCSLTIFDRHAESAAEASGNQRGILYPLLSKKQDLLGTLTKIGFNYTLDLVRSLGVDCRQGFLELASDEKKEQRLKSAAERLGPCMAQWFDGLELEERFGVKNQRGGVLIPRGIDLDPREFVQANLEASKANKVFNTEITSLEKRTSGWQLQTSCGDTHDFDIVILANASDVKKFAQTNHFPLRPARGQLAILPESIFAEVPKWTLNFSHYLTRPFEGEAILGATFDIDDDDPEVREIDRDHLIDDLCDVFPNLLKKGFDRSCVRGRTAFRCTSPDFKPVAGLVPRESEWLEIFAKVAGGQPWNRYGSAPYHEDLFVSVGHGARGLLFAPLMAEVIVAEIFDLPQPLPISIREKLHPGRFMIRKLQKGG